MKNYWLDREKEESVCFTVESGTICGMDSSAWNVSFTGWALYEVKDGIIYTIDTTAPLSCMVTYTI